MESVAMPRGESRRLGLMRSNWLRGAFLIAGAEAALIVVGLIPRWVAVGVAAAIVVGYFARGRSVPSQTARQAVWAITVSQALVLFVPLLLWVLSALVLLVLAAFAVILLVVLVLDRR
jgi:hypothetical protein